MYDKEKAIADWRARLGRSGTLFEGDLDELESHLRDELDALEEVELTGAPAFAQAEKRLGEVSLIAAEFAKVNPLLAWRTALFWLTLGCFVTLTGQPLLELIANHAVINAGMVLHLPLRVIQGVMWIVQLGVPAAFFALFFSTMSRRIKSGKPFKLASSKVFRVALVVGGAVIMLFSHLHPTVIHQAEWAVWKDTPSFWSAWETYWSTLSVLGITMPIGLAALAMILRRQAVRRGESPTRGRMILAPIFWLVIGCFVAVVRQDLGMILQQGSWCAGAIAHLSPHRMADLMWFMSFACPLGLAFSTWAFLRFRSPPPNDLLRSPRLLLTIASACIVSVGSVLAMNHNWHLNLHMEAPVITAGGRAWFMANIFTHLAIPTAVGVIMLRMLKSARSASSESTAPCA